MPNRRRYPQRTSARVIAGFFDVTVGMRLLAPDDILGAVPGYRIANQVFFGDELLGGALLVGGLLMVGGLYTDALTWPAVVATVLSLATWATFALAIFWVNPAQIGSLAYIAIAVTNGFALAHTARWQWQRTNPRSSG